jgi:hypothetical protein
MLASDLDDLLGYDTSGDGHWIAYSQQEQDRIGLYLVDARGEHKTLLADGGQAPRWGK